MHRGGLYQGKRGDIEVTRKGSLGRSGGTTGDKRVGKNQSYLFETGEDLKSGRIQYGGEGFLIEGLSVPGLYESEAGVGKKSGVREGET